MPTSFRNLLFHNIGCNLTACTVIEQQTGIRAPQAEVIPLPDRHSRPACRVCSAPPDEDVYFRTLRHCTCTIRLVTIFFASSINPILSLKACVPLKSICAWTDAQPMKRT